MKSYPQIPHVDDAPAELLDSGHLWILEHVAGQQLRFRLRDSGRIQFGDSSRVYDDPDELPAQYRHAVRHVQRQLDREALRAAVDDVERIVFFGEAMQYQGVDYEWERTPSVLGFGIWSAAAGQFRPPDAVDGIFDRLGLQAVNAVEQEVRARDFSPETYSVPQSAWYDGPAAGVVIRNKQGHCGLLPNSDVDGSGSRLPDEPTAADLADRFGSRQRFERLATELDEQGQPVTVETLFERALDSILRELHPRTFDRVDMGAFRSAVASRIRAFITER